jgi:hypothetical protein
MIDINMLSVMIAGGDKVIVKIKQDVQSWTKPLGREGTGNMGIVVKAGTTHTVIDARDGWIAVDVGNRWIPLNAWTVEVIDGETPPPPPPVEPPPATRRIIEVWVIDGKQMFSIDGGVWQ